MELVLWETQISHVTSQTYGFWKAPLVVFLHCVSVSWWYCYEPCNVYDTYDTHKQLGVRVRSQETEKGESLWMLYLYSVIPFGRIRRAQDDCLLTRICFCWKQVPCAISRVACCCLWVYYIGRNISDSEKNNLKLRLVSPYIINIV